MILDEAILVGAWTALLYTALNPFLKGLALWFILGFLKHFLAHVLKFHSFYCKINGGEGTRNNQDIFAESLAEGGMFVIAHNFAPGTWLGAFSLGCCLHLAFEVLGAHTFFIQNMCLHAENTRGTLLGPPRF